MADTVKKTRIPVAQLEQLARDLQLTLSPRKGWIKCHVAGKENGPRLYWANAKENAGAVHASGYVPEFGFVTQKSRKDGTFGTTGKCTHELDMHAGLTPAQALDLIARAMREFIALNAPPVVASPPASPPADPVELAIAAEQAEGQPS